MNTQAIESSTYPTLQDVVDQEKGGVYVINSSSNVVETGGDVHISVATKDGKTKSIIVQKSWVPVDLTSMVPRASLLDSSSFHDSVTKGLVTLISEAEFRRLYARPGASQERARLKAKEDAVRAASSNRGLGATVSVSSTSDDTADRQQASNVEVVPRGGSAKKPQSLPRVAASADGVFNMSDLSDADESAPDGTSQEVSVTFRAWVKNLNIMDADECLSAIRSRGQLPRHEVQYLVNNVNHERIVNALRKMLG